MGKGGKRLWHWLVDSFFWLTGCSVTINVIFMWAVWNWISYSKWGPLRRRHQLRLFSRYPVCMLCSKSKNSHANLLHPQFLGVFWVMWPADARAFSRPSHFLRTRLHKHRLIVDCTNLLLPRVSFTLKRKTVPFHSVVFTNNRPFQRLPVTKLPSFLSFLLIFALSWPNTVFKFLCLIHHYF